ncbi:MAG: Spy/CpxP family protein refolding chaperone [Elusimicrobia bacterium]|nr:Spy/CpxP family protein refolding chaperone [Elusimicrobiota bacterium]
MKRFFGLAVVCACLMLGVEYGFAEAPQGNEQGMPNRELRQQRKENNNEEIGNIKRYLSIKQKLNLTDEQVKALEKIVLDYTKETIKRNADIKLAGLDLREIVRQDKPDFSAARSKIKQVSSLQLDSKIAMIDAMEKGYNVLTKEQQEKLLQLKGERKEKMMKKGSETNNKKE